MLFRPKQWSTTAQVHVTLKVCSIIGVLLLQSAQFWGADCNSPQTIYSRNQLFFLGASHRIIGDRIEKSIKGRQIGHNLC